MFECAGLLRGSAATADIQLRVQIDSILVSRKLFLLLQDSSR
jgi:hypothetical protein